MGEVVTMTGDELMTPEKLLAEAAKENPSKVIIIMADDIGYLKVWLSRQSHSDVVFAAAAFNAYALDLAKEAILHEEE